MPRDKKSLNVLYVGTLPPHPGGSAILAVQVMVGLAKRGHRIRALAPIATDARVPPTPPGIEVERFAQPWAEVSPDKPTPPEFREEEGRRIRGHFPRLVEESRPDVVVVGREMFAWHVPDLATEYSLPCVLWVQGATLWGMRNGSLPREVVSTLVGKMKQVDGIVAVARHMTVPLRELGLETTHVVPNGVDLLRFHPGPEDPELRDSLDIPADHAVVLHASNLKEIKRPMDLLPAARQVLEEYPEVTWVVMGEGPLRQALVDRCQEQGLGGHFRFVDWVDHAEMPRWMRLADVVVMPSEVEALALVYLEAQAVGATLIASDIPAAREVVEDGRNGLLHPVGDTRALAAQVLQAVKDPALRERIAAECTSDIRPYALVRAVERHEAVLMDVVGG